MVFVSDLGKREADDRRGHARTARRHHRRSLPHSKFIEHLTQFGRWPKAMMLDQAIKGQILCVRHVAGRNPGTWLRRFTAKSWRAARIKDQPGITHFRERTDHVRLQVRFEVAFRWPGGSLLQGPAFFAPPWQASVEQADPLVSEGFEHPPHPRGAEESERIVNNHLGCVRNSEFPHLRLELLRRGEHVWQRGLLIRYLIYIGEDRARDVRLPVLGMRIAYLLPLAPAGARWHPLPRDAVKPSSASSAEVEIRLDKSANQSPAISGEGSKPRKILPRSA